MAVFGALVLGVVLAIVELFFPCAKNGKKNAQEERAKARRDREGARAEERVLEERAKEARRKQREKKFNQLLRQADAPSEAERREERTWATQHQGVFFGPGRRSDMKKRATYQEKWEDNLEEIWEAHRQAKEKKAERAEKVKARREAHFAKLEALGLAALNWKSDPRHASYLAATPENREKMLEESRDRAFASLRVITERLNRKNSFNMY